ncbi:hypothetical protein JYP49_19765 [Nitratireductor aquimarinus]|uniref:hypothetical protein n=1 Tax=Nitratireductor TaxID=245876 RepID=UPI0019D33B4D|nr:MULTISPECIES: hypothetical protein [Nitratireductor]MBN7778513.1 hypothetical protein [Nitratireductor pacificus]MBN7782835.1 hypothetical protein [Nitratireductor pacificus]MBN7791642.1 hypothetical protein [Nitratireductor aquimarinus]MBY6100899.1 hypothetical protein [Nitratireductor aquimarinus]MCA1262088.1 hypothetical protein [Nitratireductor aquimarinus]
MRAFSFRNIIIAALALCAVLFAVGWFTREDPADAPYLKILGGGFMFNYREAEIFYGFTAQVVRPLASGSIIEARFDDPAGGAPLVVSERVSTMTDRYALRTPPVRGVEAKKPYRVEIRVYDRTKTTLLWQEEHSYTSQIADTVVPEKPLTIGPGYHRNPELERR